MARVIKVIGGREYVYEQRSRRVNGKVVTTSVYLYPVTPRRKKRDGFGFVAVGLVSVALTALKGDLKPYKEGKPRLSPHARSAAVTREAWKPDSLDTMRVNARLAGEASRAREKPPTAEQKQLLEDIKGFNERLATARTVDGGRAIDAARVSAPTEQLGQPSQSQTDVEGKETESEL